MWLIRVRFGFATEDKKIVKDQSSCDLPKSNPILATCRHSNFFETRHLQNWLVVLHKVSRTLTRNMPASETILSKLPAKKTPKRRKEVSRRSARLMMPVRARLVRGLSAMHQTNILTRIQTCSLTRLQESLTRAGHPTVQIHMV